MLGDRGQGSQGRGLRQKLVANVESEEGLLTASSPDIPTDNGNKLLGTTLIIDDETRDRDERNDYIDE